MKTARKLLGAISGYHATNDAAVLLLPSMFPILRGVYGLSYSDIGILSGLALVITVVGQLLAGRLSDSFSPMRMVTAGVALVGLSTVAISFTGSYLELLFIVIFLRVGASFYHPVGISTIARNFKGKKLDAAMGFQSAFGDGGVFLVMATSGLIAVSFGWQLPFLIWGMAALVMAGAGAVVIKTLPPRFHRPRESSPTPYGRVFRGMLPYIFLLAVAGAVFNIIANYGPLLMVDKLGASPGLAGIVVALWLLMGVPAGLGYGKISGKLGRKPVLLTALGITGVCGALLVIISQWWMAIPIFVVMGLSAFLIYPALFSYVSESVGVGRHGTAFGLVFATQLSGGAASSYACGVLADMAGSIAIPFVVLAALAFMGGAWALALKGKRS